MDIKDLREKIIKLEFQKEAKEKELKELETKLEELSTQVKAEFGTTDLDQLAQISRDLDQELEKKASQLRELGVEI